MKENKCENLLQRENYMGKTATDDSQLSSESKKCSSPIKNFKISLIFIFFVNAQR